MPSGNYKTEGRKKTDGKGLKPAAAKPITKKPAPKAVKKKWNLDL